MGGGGGGTRKYEFFLCPFCFTFSRTVVKGLEIYVPPPPPPVASSYARVKLHHKSKAYRKSNFFVFTNDPGLCVSVSVRPRLRGIHIWYRALCKSAPVTMVTSWALYIGCKDVQLAKIRGTQNESKNHTPSLDGQIFWIRQFADIPEVELFQGFTRIWVVNLVL